MLRPHALVASTVLAALAAGCGKSSKPDPAADPAKPGSATAATTTVPATATRIAVGAFTVPVPTGWKDVSSQRAQPGQVGLLTTDRQPPVLLILSPAPTPMPFDPTDSAACATNGGHIPGVVGTPTVVTLPAGKACVVETQGDKHMTITVLAVGDKGVMAQCRFERAADHGACDPLVAAIVLGI